MNDFEPGIRKYLERIEREVGALATPRSIEERRWLTEARHSVWKVPAPDDVSWFDWWIALPGREIPVRVYRPQAEGRLPVVLYIHGGGFVASSYATHDAITWGIARQTGALVISVNYRRAPENPYPAAPDDCLATLDWIVEHADLLGADPRRLAVAGDSAGGCLATVLAAHCADRGRPGLRMQALLYPCLDTRFDRRSMVDDRDPMLSREAMRFFWDAYLGGRLDTDDARAVPMRRASLAGLAPAYLLVGEFDPLRDETLEYAERLRGDGVATECRVLPGCIHGLLRARFVSEAASEAFDRLCDALRQALRD
ncbi:MAG: alpha/beta hydrolase [Burkholderiaceae bacterium]